jgi:hypothetical protein
MGSFELMGQMHIHVDSGHGGLNVVGSIQHVDGVLDPFDSHLLDINVPMVLLVLDVFHMPALAPGCPGLLGWMGGLETSGKVDMFVPRRKHITDLSGMSIQNKNPLDGTTDFVGRISG